jgi:hypothetical protein
MRCLGGFASGNDAAGLTLELLRRSARTHHAGT